MQSLIKALCSAALLTVLVYLNSDLEEKVLRSIAGTTASISGTLFGFVLASLAILLGLSTEKLIQNMSKTGHFKKLLTELKLTAAYFLVSVVLSLLIIFLPSFYSIELVWNLTLSEGISSLSSTVVIIGFIYFYQAWKKLTMVIDNLC